MKISFCAFPGAALLFLMVLQSFHVRAQILIPSDTIPKSSPSAGMHSTGFLPKKFTTNLQFGSYFTTTSGFGSSFSTYVSPTVSYAFNPKFRISAGITVVNSSLYGTRPWFNSGQEVSMNGNYTHAILSVSGDYLISNKLTLSGYLFKDIDLYSTLNNSNTWKPENPQGGYLKLGYQVNDHFHIEGGIGYSKGVDPYRTYYGSPYAPGIFPY